MEHFYKNIQGWFDFEEIYCKAVLEAPFNAHFVEIGAWKGCSTAFLAVEILNSGKQIQLDVVDTWDGSPNEEFHLQEASITNLYLEFLSNLDPLFSVVNINPKRSTSTSAAAEYKDESLDFVFIDANHEFTCVNEDIKAWLPKLKPGCIMAGHDYDPGWPGVIQAVQENIGVDEICVVGTSWVYRRPNYSANS